MGSGHFSYSQNASTPRYLLIIYRVYRVYHVSFYSHFVQNIQSFIIKKYSLYIVGEVRGAETFELLTCLNTGHDGSFCTCHANSTQDTIGRLETMVLMGMDMPLSAIRKQVASGFGLMIHLGRLKDGSRRILEIAQPIGFAEGEVLMRTIYRFESVGVSEDGKIQGELRKTGELAHEKRK